MLLIAIALAPRDGYDGLCFKWPSEVHVLKWWSPLTMLLEDRRIFRKQGLIKGSEVTGAMPWKRMFLAPSGLSLLPGHLVNSFASSTLFPTWCFATPWAQKPQELPKDWNFWTCTKIKLSFKLVFLCILSQWLKVYICSIISL